MNRLPAIHCAAAIAFTAMAAVGLGFLALGPVSLIRTFGLVALIAGVAGCAIHAHLARAESPDCWDDLKGRLGFDEGYRAKATRSVELTAAASS